MTTKPTQPAGGIEPDAVTISDTGTHLYDNETALRIVMDDVERDDNYMVINQWPAGWLQAITLLQSPQDASAFQGGISGAPSVPMFTLSNHLSAIQPKMHLALFYENPPFMLRPRPQTSPEMTNAKRDLFTYQLDDMEFESEVNRLELQFLLFGTCIAKWGWEDRTITEQKFVQKSPSPYGQNVHTKESDEFDVVDQTRRIARPWFKACDIRQVLVDSGCRVGDIRTAKHIVFREYPVYDDLDALRDQPGYHIPPAEELKAWFFRPRGAHPDNIAMTIPESFWGYLQTALPRNYATNADPLDVGLELLEHWTPKTMIAVLRHGDDCILIYNGENPYGIIPAFSANFRDLPDVFYGQGLGLLIGSEQVVQQDIRNLALGMLSFGLQPVAIRNMGLNPPAQDIPWRQGQIIDVEGDVDKAFRFLEFPNVPGDAWQALANSEAVSQEASGANQQVTLGAGSAGVRTTGMRSGTGAGLVGQANANRIDGPLDRFCRQIFVPWLYQMDQLNKQRLPASVLRDILQSETDASPVNHIEFRNAKHDFEILAGSHLGPKQEMAQAIPFIIQLINNPTFESMLQAGGDMFDAKATFKNFADIAGWKYAQNFIRKMTPQEQQRAQQNSPAALQAQKGQQAQQSQLAQFQQQEKLQDEQVMGRGANEAIRQMVDHALQPGEPAGGGLGTESTEG